MSALSIAATAVSGKAICPQGLRASMHPHGCVAELGFDMSKPRSKPQRMPLFPWRIEDPAPEDVDIALSAEQLDMLPEIIAHPAGEFLQQAGFPNQVSDYGEADVIERVRRHVKRWVNPASQTSSSPPLWEAAQAMRYANGLRMHLRAGNMRAAAWCAHIATMHVWRLQTTLLEKPYLQGAASLAGSRAGGRIRSKTHAVANALAAIERDHPGLRNREYAERIARLRGDDTEKAVRALEVAISRLRKKKVVTVGAL